MTADDGDHRDGPSVWAAAMQHLADAGDRIAALMVERDEPTANADAFVALPGVAQSRHGVPACADRRRGDVPPHR
jgi:hypothetical protein